MPSEKNINGLILGLAGILALVLALSVAAFSFLRKGDVLPPLKTVAKDLKVEQRAALESAPTPIGEAMRLYVSETNAAELQGVPEELDDTAPIWEKGRVSFAKFACNACHSLDGSRVVGPTMMGLFGAQRSFVDGTTATADAAYLRRSIEDPNAQVVEGYPPIMVLGVQPTSEEIDELIAFIEFVKDGDPGAAAAPAEAVATEAETDAKPAAADAPTDEATADAVSSEAGGSSEGGGDLAAAGKAAFQQLTCFACHTVDGKASVGPSLAGTFGTERKLVDGSTVLMDEAYVRNAILDPNSQVVEGFMPLMALPVQPSADQLDALVAYIASLGAG